MLTAGEGESALSVSAFYGWLDWVKRLVETVGLDPKGENGTSRKSFLFTLIDKLYLSAFCLLEPPVSY